MRLRAGVDRGVWLASLAQAATVEVRGPRDGGFAARVVSVKEARFTTTVRQQFDFSCGSAAVATLLTHHYGIPVTEREVFAQMFERGDQAKIRKEGFSMLDMKRYLESRGLHADGFKQPRRAARAGEPAGHRAAERTRLPAFRGGEGNRCAAACWSATRPWARARCPFDRFSRLWVNQMLFVIHNRREMAKFNLAERLACGAGCAAVPGDGSRASARLAARAAGGSILMRDAVQAVAALASIACHRGGRRDGTSPTRLTFAQATPVADGALDEVRGGFEIPANLRASLTPGARGVRQRRTRGQPQRQDSRTSANMTAEQANALAHAAGTLLIQNGPNNAFNVADLGPASTVIQNTLNDQHLVTLTTISVEVNSLGAFREMDFQDGLRDGARQHAGCAMKKLARSIRWSLSACSCRSPSCRRSRRRRSPAETAAASSPNKVSSSSRCRRS